MHVESAQVIKPSTVHALEICCNVSDIMVANLAVNIVFFFERHLDTRALAAALAGALTNLPLFAGRRTLAHGAMRIRIAGTGVLFTSASSDYTLPRRSGRCPRTEDSGSSTPSTAIGFSWHHTIGDMQTAMILTKAWAAAAAGEPLAEPLIVEDRAAYLSRHLPVDGARGPGVRFLGPVELARSALYLAKDARRHPTLRVYFSDGEIARMRS